MARILYFSTHEPLEYDDITLFHSMGHTVFSIGKFCPTEPMTPVYRKPIEYPPETDVLCELFRKENCQSAFMDLEKTRLTAAFLNAFDFIIVIQDVSFIQQYWDIIDGPIVVWRTVGQAIEHADRALETYRSRGLRIVRWSDREQFADVYIGHDAIIRAYKDPNEYGPWNGVRKNTVTFSNSYKARYPIEFGLMQRVCHLLDYGVGGSGNEDVPNALGLMSLDDMKRTLNEAAVYFYCHGSTVPYTLNFIEAWMTGLPVLAAGRNVEIHNIDMRYNEINDFIIHGVNGFLFKSERQAKGILMHLMLDKDYAGWIGAQGRKTAIRLFSKERAAADWRMFLNANTPSANQSD